MLAIPRSPELYSRFSAAYNYRNTFGVALAYGPFFDTPAQQDQVSGSVIVGLRRKLPPTVPLPVLFLHGLAGARRT